MNWSDERYVRLYTRRTADWLAFTWQARALLPQMLMVADRTGLVALRMGDSRTRLLAGVTLLPEEVAAPGVADLMADGCVLEVDAGYLIRNFIEAQEAEASDKKRAREYRDRKRSEIMENVTVRDASSRNRGGSVTKMVENVTPSLSVPSVKKSIVELDSTPVGQVFEHWRSVMKHPRAVLDAKRKKAIAARLKDGRSVEDLKRAVDGCARTPHNMGQNEQRQRYDDIELICRSDVNVTRFLANAQKSNGMAEALSEIKKQQGWDEGESNAVD